MTLRFGKGEFEAVEKGRDPDAITQMRWEFLPRASKANPQIVDHLHDSVLPIYERVPLIHFQADPKRSRRREDKELQWKNARANFNCVRRPGWRILEDAWSRREPGQPLIVDYPDYYARIGKGGRVEVPLQAPLHEDPLLTDFVERLFDWSEKFRISTPWARRHAYETLNLWTANEAFKSVRLWDLQFERFTSSPSSPELPEIQPPAIDLPSAAELTESLSLSLYPSWVSRERVEEQLRSFKTSVDAVTKGVLEFLDERDAAAENAKWFKAKLKKNPEHFDWLVHAQVMGKSYEEVFQHFLAPRLPPPTPGTIPTDHVKTVRRAVNELSKLIGLPLRADLTRPGRPSSK